MRPTPVVHRRDNPRHATALSKPDTMLRIVTYNVYAGGGDRLDCIATLPRRQRAGPSRAPVIPTTPPPSPGELVRRCLCLYTYRGDLVVDPFCGRGTTPAVAVGLGRRIHASDLVADNVTLSRHRVARARAVA